MALLRKNYPNAFDGDVTRSINDSFFDAPLMIDHMNVNDDLSGRDMVKIDADSTFAKMPVKGESIDIQTDDPIERYSTIFTHLTYAMGFEVSYEMVQDDKRLKVARWAKSLGASAREAINVLCADILNDGFTTTGGDGKALFATDHPTAGSDVANKPASAVDLSTTSLNAAVYNLLKTVDHRGKRMPISAMKLLVAPENEKLASEITGSTLASGTANNDINYFKGRVSFNGSNPYFTDGDAWFVQANTHGLSLFMRELPNAGSYMKNGNLGIVHFMKFRASAGPEFWRGMYGSAGA